MSRADKTAAIAELAEKFRSSNATVLTEYRGLSVKQITDLRGALRGNATYAVVKNTLTELAAKEAGITAFDGQLVGPSAIAFVDGDPVEAAKYARVVATGRSDFANQINNVLVFPGVFRGLLDSGSKVLTPEVLLAAADALAAVVKDEERNATYIIPSVFNRDVAREVAAAVSEVAERTDESGEPDQPTVERATVG